jgi:hypothetical protein
MVFFLAEILYPKATFDLDSEDDVTDEKPRRSYELKLLL